MKTEPIHLFAELDTGEIELEVRGQFYPARDATYHRDGWDPPEPATFEVDSVRVGGVDASNELIAKAETAMGQSVEAACLEEMGER